MLFVERERHAQWLSVLDTPAAVQACEKRAEREQALQCVVATKHQEWRQWVMRQFERQAIGETGNEGANVVLGWHGQQRAQVLYDIGSVGFLTREQLAAAGLQPGDAQWQDSGGGRLMDDRGWYGRGHYFTQWPSYGARSASGGGNTLLLSYLCLGQVYPVTEWPDPHRSALYGRAVQSGYDSHYAVVHHRATDDAPVAGYPCTPDVRADGDEIVVRSSAQVRTGLGRDWVV